MKQHKKSLIFFSFFVLFVSYYSLHATEFSQPILSIGPETQTPDLAKYQHLFYVSFSEDSDQAGQGTKTKPWRSVVIALANLHGAAPANRFAVLVSSGVYSDTTIQMKPFVDLYGGFDPATWKRDIVANRTILDGGGVRRVIVGADNALLDGFVISSGVVRGKGAGIFCRSVSPIIRNNVFSGNKTLAPTNWNPKYRHEIANDGAAFYGEGGASPVIENNLFVNNSTEAGRGAGIALQRNCSGKIAGNVFLQNVTGLEDPLRSSDGGAISVFDWSNPVIQNNIILNNKALHKNDSGGLFVALWSSPEIDKNIFVGNSGDDDAGALFIGGQEHRYDAPLDPLPPAEKFFVRVTGNLFVGNVNPSRNSGVMRMTMETRGLYANNISAFNTGIYFQRSEVAVVNNTILDNFLFVETKAGLKAGKIVNNIIWADFDLQTGAPVSFCDIKNGYPGEGNFLSDPHFVQDGLVLHANAVNYQAKKFISEIYTADQSFRANELMNRVVKAGGKWSVIKSNTEHSISVWGDFSGNVEFLFLPTFHLQNNSPCIDVGRAADAPGDDFDNDARPLGSGVDVGADENHSEKIK